MRHSCPDGITTHLTAHEIFTPRWPNNSTHVVSEIKINFCSATKTNVYKLILDLFNQLAKIFTIILVEEFIMILIEKFRRLLCMKSPTILQIQFLQDEYSLLKFFSIW